MEFDTIFYNNPKKESKFRYRATHINGRRSTKAIFCNASPLPLGKLCRVRIKSIKKPASEGRGYIEVEFLSQQKMQLDDSLYVDPMIQKKLQAMIESGMNILLDGPQGSGKTILSKNIAEALDMQYVFFNCSAIFESTDFLANIQVQSTKNNQIETVWVKTDILRALEGATNQPGKQYLIFLDEFNRCREMARNGIMPALDATRKLFNPLTGSFIEIPDNVLWIAAINNGDQYTGTTNVDPAQLDRFAPLKLAYPPFQEELLILAKRHPGIKERNIQRIVRTANAIRTDKRLAMDLSMRATEEVCTLLGHPNFSNSEGDDPIPELLKSSFCGRFYGSWNDESSDAGLVWHIIVKSLRI